MNPALEQVVHNSQQYTALVGDHAKEVTALHLRQATDIHALSAAHHLHLLRLVVNPPPAVAPQPVDVQPPPVQQQLIVHRTAHLNIFSFANDPRIFVTSLEIKVLCF